eukprot:7585209-Alexandrium_andersonii.AAC.1
MVKEELRCPQAVHPSKVLGRPYPRLQGSEKRAAESSLKIRCEVGRTLVPDEPKRLVVLLGE